MTVWENHYVEEVKRIVAASLVSCFEIDFWLWMAACYVTRQILSTVLQRPLLDFSNS